MKSNTTICKNRQCGKEYYIGLKRCPYCGTHNNLYCKTYENKSTSYKGNNILRISITILFAFGVLALCWVVVAAIGYADSVGAKGLITGISIAAASWLETYLKRHEKKNNATTLIIVLLAALIPITIALVMIVVPRQIIKEFESAKADNTIEAYMAFINKRRNHTLADEARDSVVSIYRNKYEILEIPVLQEDLDPTLREMLRTMRDERIDQAYHAAKEINTLEGWRYYMSIVPSSCWRDAEMRIGWIEEDMRWGSEASAWQTASARNDIEAYEKYLSLYPRGIHERTAERRLIDLDVDAVFAGEHGDLPAMDKTYSTGASYSIIDVENRTDYDLTVSYSGADSKRIVIAPHKTKQVRLGNGNYRIAAKVGHGVTPFAGEEYLDGSNYSVYYYIVTYSSHFRY